MKQYLLLLVFLTPIIQPAFSQSVSLDTTFGTGGKMLQSLAPVGDDFMNAIAVQQDGKIVVCTLKDFTLAGTVIITRFNLDGTLDTGFGGDGIVETQVVSESGGSNLMKLQSDGKILITGSKSTSLTNPNSDFFDLATMRYNPDGTVDTDFGTNGIVITDFNGKGDDGCAVDLQSDNKIIVAGYTYLNNNLSICVCLVRYSASGVIDTTFGINGKVVLPALGTNSADFTNCLKVTSNDGILIGVDTGAQETFDHYNIGIFKLHSNGALDTSFNTSGYTIAAFGFNNYDSVCTVDEDNGKVIFSGFATTPGGRKMVLGRYLADGTPDSTFGVDGFFVGNKNGSSTYDAIGGMKIRNNGKLLCTGYTEDGSDKDFLLIQFNADGTIDTGFNTTGYFMTDFNNNTDDRSDAIAIGADDKIVCAGITDLNAIRATSLARYDLSELSNASFTAKSFLVYPNPFTDWIIIESKGTSQSNASIALYDSIGRKLSEYKMQDAANCTFPMDKDLASGNYFLKIGNEGKIETIKIIKQ